MAGFGFSVAFDPVSMAEIEKFWYGEFLMKRATWDAMEASLAVLQVNVKDHMDFKNPTGKLEDSLRWRIYSGLRGMLYTRSPYAWRREEGFSGMTDSLGRYYANDPGVHYMQLGLEDSLDLIEQNFVQAVEKVLSQLGDPGVEASFGGGP